MTLPARRSAALAALFVATGCSFPLAHRDAVPGEKIALDAVTVTVPPGEGWKVTEGGLGYRRSVIVRHETAGKTDRYLRVDESALPTPPPTPADLLAATQRAVGPAAVAPDDRFGAFSVAWSQRVEGGPRTAPSSVRWYTFVPPLRLDRSYVVGYGERGAEPGPELDARAREALAAVALAPAPSEPVGRFWRGGVRGSLYSALEAGFAPFRLRGTTYLGYAARVGSGGFALARGTDRGTGGELDVAVFAGRRDGTDAAVVTLAPRWIAVRGRVRAGLGLDLGLEARRRTGWANPRYGAVVGPNGFASVDLHDAGPLSVYAGLDAGAATPGFYRAAVLLGVRAHLAPL